MVRLETTHGIPPRAIAIPRAREESPPSPQIRYLGDGPNEDRGPDWHWSNTASDASFDASEQPLYVPPPALEGTRDISSTGLTSSAVATSEADSSALTPHLIPVVSVSSLDVDKGAYAQSIAKPLNLENKPKQWNHDSFSDRYASPVPSANDCLEDFSSRPYDRLSLDASYNGSFNPGASDHFSQSPTSASSAHQELDVGVYESVAADPRSWYIESTSWYVRDDSPNPPAHQEPDVGVDATVAAEPSSWVIKRSSRYVTDHSPNPPDPSYLAHSPAPRISTNMSTSIDRPTATPEASHYASSQMNNTATYDVDSINLYKARKTAAHSKPYTMYGYKGVPSNSLQYAGTISYNPIGPKSANLTHPILSRITTYNRQYEHGIPAYINDIKTVAFPDNCSVLNIISEDFARRNKFEIIHTAKIKLRLPNQTRVESRGSISLQFRFEGESTIFDLLFVVLPSCVCNVVLSSDFLRATETFTTFKSRIQQWITSHRLRPRICLLGRPKHLVCGSINGRVVSASPDTGSDVNVISRKLAEGFGLDISTETEAIQILEFIDGSTVETYGVVYNVEWKFGSLPALAPVSQTSRRDKMKESKVGNWKYGSDARPTSIYLCDFYVLENLSCDVILSADLLYGTNAFTACADYFYESYEPSLKGAREESDVWVLKKKRRTLKGFICGSQSSNTQLPNTPAATDKTVIEANRRKDELNRIAALPPDKQPQALEAERQRKEQWNRQNFNQSISNTVSQATSSANQSQTIHSPALQNSQPQAAPPIAPQPSSSGS